MTIDSLREKINTDYNKSDLKKWLTALPKHEPLKSPLMQSYNKGKISKSEIESILSSTEWLDEESASIEVKNLIKGKTKKNFPTRYKKGDTLMHPIFRHPYVLLEKSEDGWICGLLTSEENCNEILEKCNSRFFESSFFTKVLFTVNEPIGTYMFPFDNNRQTNSILVKLKSIFK